MPKIILFTGAPPPSIDPAAYTVTTFSPPFLQLLNLPNPDPSSTHPDLDAEASAPPAVSWRSLPPTRRQLHTGFSPTHDIHGFYDHHQDFFTTADVTLSPSRDEDEGEDLLTLTKFYEESFAAHNSLQTVQDSFQTTCSEENTTNLDMLDTCTPRDVPSPPISDLEDVPSAAHITSLIPQTITKNLILAVLSIAQPRAVTTRWGSTFSLVEVLVGDDTRSGFAITFWLPSRAQDSAVLELTRQVLELRRQDVVFVRNVALGVFRGKVYGQSLPRGMTKVKLLWRREGGGRFSARDLAKRGKGEERVKARRVRNWAIRFVGGTGRRSRARVWDKPPDDTQE